MMKDEAIRSTAEAIRDAPSDARVSYFTEGDDTLLCVHCDMPGLKALAHAYLRLRSAAEGLRAADACDRFHGRDFVELWAALDGKSFDEAEVDRSLMRESL